MTNLNKFKSRLSSDKGLQKRMREASTIKDVVKIAKSVGCDVTENEVKDDMMKAVSGGSDIVGTVSSAFGTAGGVGSVNADTDVTTGDIKIDWTLMDFTDFLARSLASF